MIMQKYCEFLKTWHGLGSKTLQRGFHKQGYHNVFSPYDNGQGKFPHLWILQLQCKVR
jgi:hypothetical protein